MPALTIDTSADIARVIVHNTSIGNYEHEIQSDSSIHNARKNILAVTKQSGSKVVSLSHLVSTSLLQAKITLADISEINVVTGPGSWSSIRIGTTFANCLAWCQNKPIFGISNFLIAALSSYQTEKNVDFLIFAKTNNAKNLFYGELSIGEKLNIETVKTVSVQDACTIADEVSNNSSNDKQNRENIIIWFGDNNPPEYLNAFSPTVIADIPDAMLALVLSSNIYKNISNLSPSIDLNTNGEIKKYATPVYGADFKTGAKRKTARAN